MASHSLISLLFLSILPRALAAPQEALSATQAPQFLQTAAPDLQGGASSAPSCGGCYLVADVAGLVWYSEVFINTAATAVVSVGVANGSTATASRTSVIQDEGQFTFNPVGPTENAALTQVNYESTVNVGGAILASPTAYNVFTAYSVTSAYLSNGQCVTTSGSAITLSSAYSEVLSTASGKVVLDAHGQQQFIDHLGFSTCSGGGENIVPTALVQVTNTTATRTSTFSNIPLAAVSLSIAPQASTPAKVSAGTTSSFPSASAPLIVIGNHTITPSRNPIGLPIYNGTVVPSSGKFVVGPTGSLNTTSAPASYLGGASGFRGMDQWLWAWASMMIGMLGVVYYL